MVQVCSLCKAWATGILVIDRLGDIQLECIRMTEWWFNLGYYYTGEIIKFFPESPVVFRFFLLTGNDQEQNDYYIYYS